MSKKKKNKEITASPDFEPPYDGFFTSSVASTNESTGYAVTVPENEEAAKELSLLGKNPNTQSRRHGKDR